MMNKRLTPYLRTKNRRNPWRKIHGARISGILCEIDARRGMLRFRKGRRVEVIRLKDYMNEKTKS